MTQWNIYDGVTNIQLRCLTESYLFKHQAHKIV